MIGIIHNLLLIGENILFYNLLLIVAIMGWKDCLFIIWFSHENDSAAYGLFYSLVKKLRNHLFSLTSIVEISIVRLF
jgi:hypothetical protein